MLLRRRHIRTNMGFYYKNSIYPKNKTKQQQTSMASFSTSFHHLLLNHNHHHHLTHFPKYPSTSLHSLHHPPLPSSNLLRSSIRVRATSTLVATQPPPSVQQSVVVEGDVFACPLCYKPLIRKGPPGFNVPAIYRSGFKCQTCSKAYSSKEIYLDLTVTSGTKEYTESKPTRTELFRSPLVSFVYERGWCQNFNQRGFPGPDEEFKMAQEYFKSVEGGLLVDVSCGSGLFSRKFAKSGIYSAVVALDFSENMLRQCYDFIRKDESILNANLALVRADISRLPFSLGSVDAVHAGASLHCWPSPSNAVAEISRILRSGGVFVGTTFLSSAPNSFRQATSSGYSYLTEAEIKDLIQSCGFINYTSKVQQAFIIFSAQKP